MAKSQAQKTAAAVKHGVKTRVNKKRTSIKFRKPKTLKLTRAPRYERAPLKNGPKLDAFTILKMPHSTTKTVKLLEDHNTITYIVDVRATKNQIKNAFKELYQIEAERINTLVRPQGDKKAYIKLPEDQEAVMIANKIGYY
ncbi:hypothetical protein PCE1_003396 [Barthelona sp. PCE]